MKSKSYEEFVEKFKHKKTTDDCYTPPDIYECVKDWAVEEYGLQDAEIVRPFYPGGDYENFPYKKNTVVIDNPPFSILGDILRFYQKHGIKFFLFAPHLTMIKRIDGVCFLVANLHITYENGAKVNTSFVTNLDKYRIRTVPELAERLKGFKRLKKPLPKYDYPPNVVTATSLGLLADRGIKVKIGHSESYYIRGLDEQRAIGKKIFGYGLLVSDKKAEELAKAAKMTKTEERICFELSEREKDIVRTLKNE